MPSLFRYTDPSGFVHGFETHASTPPGAVVTRLRRRAWWYAPSFAGLVSALCGDTPETLWSEEVCDWLHVINQSDRNIRIVSTRIVAGKVVGTPTMTADIPLAT